MCLYPIKIKPHKKGDPRGSGEVIEVSCGKCLECVRNKSMEWAYRIMHEASFYEQNCVLTLTYDNDHLPYPPSISRREVQLFMKRFRQEITPLKVRFFACGEYGKKFHRPHYHIIIFGYFPEDSYDWSKDGKHYFRSPTIEKVWTFGYSLVDRVTFDTALYCAKYLSKYAWTYFPRRFNADPEGDPDCPFNLDMQAPFVQMSNRPGIGYDYVYRCDLKSDRVYCNGKSIKIPRYYLKVMERDGIYLDEFKEARQKRGEMVARLTDIDKKRDQYYEKFLVKKYVKKL